MTIKNILPIIFPEGEFVSFDQIHKGDIIIRGGESIHGHKIENTALILRAWRHEDNKYGEYWYASDDELSCAAFKHKGKATVEWYYRIKIGKVIAVNTPTDFEWSSQIAKLVEENINAIEITYDDIEVGQTILTMDCAEESIETGFIPDIYLGKVSEENENGWKADEEEIEFYLTLSSRLFDCEDKIWLLPV